MAVINNSIINSFHRESIIPKSIKKGSRIKVKHYSTFEPITRIISSIDGNKMVTELPQKLLDTNVSVGDTIVCIYFDEDIEYVLNGEIIDISLFLPHKMTIKVENVEKYTNKRRQPRYSVSLSANVKAVNDDNIYFAIVRNISLLGVSFTSKKRFDENTEIIINVAVSEDIIITFYGRIIRNREMDTCYEYGVLQTSIDELNKDELDKFIDSLEDEEESMFLGKAE